MRLQISSPPIPLHINHAIWILKRCTGLLKQINCWKTLSHFKVVWACFNHIVRSLMSTHKTDFLQLIPVTLYAVFFIKFILLMITVTSQALHHLVTCFSQRCSFETNMAFWGYSSALSLWPQWHNILLFSLSKYVTS